MPSTYSSSLRLELVADGEQSGVWGQTTNRNLGELLEQAIGGVTTVDVTSSDATLTALNGVIDQARSSVLRVVGTPGVARTVTVPNVRKLYKVDNRSDSVTKVKTPTGAAFDVPALSVADIYCDGMDNIYGRAITDGADLVNRSANPLHSPAFTGDPTAPTQAISDKSQKIATTEFVKLALEAFQNTVYPVGSIYMNADSSADPATLLGFGTWQKIAEGRALFGYDQNVSAFDSMGKTGGSRDAIVVQHSHGFSGTTGNESNTHTHSVSGNTGIQSNNHTHTGVTSTAGDHRHSVSLHDGGYFNYSGGGGVPGVGTPRVGGDTGWAGSHNHSFTTSGQSADHTHAFSATSGNASTTHTHSITGTTDQTGVSGTDANLPPYLVVAIWKRTA